MKYKSLFHKICVFCLVLFLVGCSTPLASTPAATSVPFEDVYPQVVKDCENALVTPIFGGFAKEPVVIVSGSGDNWGSFSSDNGAVAPAEVKTVVCIGSETYEVHYANGDSGTKSNQLVRLMEWPGGKVLGGAFIPADSPYGIGDVVNTAVSHKTFSADTEIESLAFSPDGKSIAYGGGHQTGVFDLTTGKLEYILTNEIVSSLAFSPDGKMLVAGGGGGTWIKLWDMQTHELIRSYDTESGVSTVAFSPDGKMIASSGFGSGEVELWEMNSENLIMAIKDNTTYVQSVAFSPDGKLLAAGGWDKSVKIWETTTGKIIHNFNTDSIVWSVAFSPDGKYLAWGNDNGEILFWELKTEQRAKTLRSHIGPVQQIGFSADGNLLISAGQNDGSLKIWDLAKGEIVQTILRFTKSWGGFFAISPDGKTIASAEGMGDFAGMIVLWDITVQK